MGNIDGDSQVSDPNTMGNVMETCRGEAHGFPQCLPECFPYCFGLPPCKFPMLFSPSPRPYTSHAAMVSLETLGTLRALHSLSRLASAETTTETKNQKYRGYTSILSMSWAVLDKLELVLGLCLAILGMSGTVLAP